MRAASLEKLPCHVDFPHISSIALLIFYQIFLRNLVPLKNNGLELCSLKKGASNFSKKK